MNVRGQATDSEEGAFWEENKVLILGIGAVVLVLVCFGLGVLAVLWRTTQTPQIEPTATPTFVTPPVPPTFTPILTDTPPYPRTRQY